MLETIYNLQANITCIIILGIMLFTTPKESYNSRRGKNFRYILISAIAFCFSDLIAFVFQGTHFIVSGPLEWISNILYCSIMMFTAFLWMCFSIHILNEKIIRPFMISVGVVGLIVILINLTSPFTGWTFTIDADNIYHRGSLIFINWIYVFAAEIVPIFFIFNSKAKTKEKIAIVLYPIAPFIAAILQYFFYGITVGQVSLTISIVLIYTMIQSHEVDEHKLKLKLSNELCNTDPLTGIGNRRAYETRVESLKNSEWVGVAFFDINGLKSTNDKYGHVAGDELICGFTKLLEDSFGKHEIFRVSGDEFLVLTQNKDTFHNGLDAINKYNDDRASMGYKEGPGESIEQLIKGAEGDMYVEKSFYYLKAENDRRKT